MCCHVARHAVTVSGVRVGQRWQTHDGDITYEVLAVDYLRVECKITDLKVSRRTTGNRVGKKPSVSREWLVANCTMIGDSNEDFTNSSNR